MKRALRRLRSRPHLLYLYAEYCHLKIEYKKSLISAKKSHNQELESAFRKARGSKDFWDAVKDMKPPRNQTSNEITDDIWLAHYKKIFHSDLTPQIDDLTDIIAHNDNILDRQFTVNELRRGIKQLKNKKAPGIDGYINEIWKALPPHGLAIMCELFNKIYSESSVPPSWCMVCICPLHKKGDPSVPANYRPISLVSTKLKLFTTILNNRLLSWNVHNNLISEFQAAYRPGFGCYHHNFLLNSIIDSHLRQNKHLYCLYVDLSGAFDSVTHNLLWKKLNFSGISSKFIECIKSIYT